MLRAKYKSGSSLILPKSNDIDYIYYYDTESERREAVLNNTEHDIDIHFTTLEKAKKVFLGCYIYPFMEHIEGDEIDFASFDMFDETIKTQYIALLKRYINLNHADKEWYHIYIAVKMYDKGKINLTKTELNTAQKIHDNGIDGTNYQYIIDYLEKAQ